MTWFSDCCVAGITGLQSLLLRTGNIEVNYHYMERIVQTIEKEQRC